MTFLSLPDSVESFQSPFKKDDLDSGASQDRLDAASVLADVRRDFPIAGRAVGEQ